MEEFDLMRLLLLLLRNRGAAVFASDPILKQIAASNPDCTARKKQKKRIQNC
jgi:hypothetical protein